MKIENPPAFPQGHLDGPEVNPSGMTLRDYFAAKCISLFSVEREDVKKMDEGHNPDHARVARFCYGLADAMLLERSKKEEIK